MSASFKTFLGCTHLRNINSCHSWRAVVGSCVLQKNFNGLAACHRNPVRRTFGTSHAEREITGCSAQAGTFFMGIQRKPFPHIPEYHSRVRLVAKSYIQGKGFKENGYLSLEAITTLTATASSSKGYNIIHHLK